MADEYIRRQDAVSAIEFGITLASVINIETGERTELFQRENDELREAVERIKDIEPVDVAPVKHGKWIKQGKQMIINLENAREQYAALGYPHRNEYRLQCSLCRKITMVDGGIVYEYCPHCGADMR